MRPNRDGSLQEENGLTRERSQDVALSKHISEFGGLIRAPIRGQSLLSTQSEFVNRNYPTADPKSRLLSQGARRWNASNEVRIKKSELGSRERVISQEWSERDERHTTRRDRESRG